jgi:periplasmic copper chaperone A
MNDKQLIFGLAFSLCASANVMATPDTAPHVKQSDVLEVKMLAKPASLCLPKIEKPWIRSAPPGAKTLVGYLVLKNPCKTSIKIVDVESKDFGMPMMHRTVQENGVSKMREPGVLEIKPGASLKFEAGGLHVMLMQPLRALKEGDKAGVRFVLSDGQKVYAEFPVLKQAPTR